MKAHDIKLSNGRKTFFGKLFVSEKELVFLCFSTGNAMLDGALTGFGGRLVIFVKALLDKKKFGKTPPDISEEDILKSAAEMPNSIIFQPSKIEKIHHTWSSRYIKWEGKTMGIKSSFSNELKQELVPWARKWNQSIIGF